MRRWIQSGARKGMGGCRRLAKRLLAAVGRTRSMKGFRARIEVLEAPPAVRLGQAARCWIKVRNTGERAWPARGLFPVHLAYHWRLPQFGDHAVDNGPRVQLPRAVRPGEEVTVECDALAPNTVSKATLVFDLVRERVGWFGRHGSSPAEAPCQVTGMEARDGIPGFDYHDFYRQFDLNENYWRVVGPGSKDEFEAMGKAKLQGLIAVGLKPDSRVLDVGCGTGQLTGPLLDYLSPAGLYYGTDIAAEAIAFCREKYRRPNFFFVQNEMTGLPIQGVQFDVIYLGSVFTHMYPAEVRDMLVELRRLLAPRGLIVADAFASSAAKEHEGSRCQVEINENLLFAIFKEVGLHVEVQARLDLHATCQRLIFHLTHAAAGAGPAV